MSSERRRTSAGDQRPRTPGRIARAVTAVVRERATRSSPVDAVPPTVLDLASRSRWPHGVPEPEFLSAIQDELRSRPRGKVAVVGGRSVRVLAKVLRRVYPELTLVEVDPRADWSQAHVLLCAANPYNLIVDVADPDAADQVERFQRSFLHLGREGAYLVRRVRVPRPVRRRDDTETPGPTEGLDLAQVLELALTTPWAIETPASVRDVASLGSCLGTISRVGEALLVRNARRVRPKVREEEVNSVLERRPDIGRLVLTRPGSTLVSRCDYEENTSLLEYHPVDRFDDPNRLAVLKSPPLHLRVYSGPTCGRGQIVESQGLFLADTFRHHPARRMVNVFINDKADFFGESRTPLGSPLPLAGAYFHFDSEWPGHFGHTMTEQISRLWAFEQAKALEPDLKLLTTLPRSRPDQHLQAWELALLEPYGVGVDDVVVFDQTVRPERLYAATPMFSCPFYVHEKITETWDLIGRSLAARSTAAERPRRIFCSRRTSLKRACRNTPEVEEFFVEHGFTVIYPEDYPLPEQAAMFQAADVVAGFAGSGLFTMAFCESPKTFIMIGPESYTARNEYMFAAVRGHRLRAVWSRPDIEHPEGRWTAAAFGSSFAVDFEREGRYLRDVVRSLSG